MFPEVRVLAPYHDNDWLIVRQTGAGGVNQRNARGRSHSQMRDLPIGKIDKICTKFYLLILLLFFFYTKTLKRCFGVIFFS